MKQKPRNDWTLYNKESIKLSKQVGCTVCRHIFPASLVTNYGGDNLNEHGECPLGCSTDSLIPDHDFTSDNGLIDQSAFKRAVHPPKIVKLWRTKITVDEPNIYSGELCICEDHYDYLATKILNNKYENSPMRLVKKKEKLPPYPVLLLKVVNKGYLYSGNDYTASIEIGATRDEACILNPGEVLLSATLQSGIDMHTPEFRKSAQALKRLHSLRPTLLTQDPNAPGKYVFDRAIDWEFYAIGTEHQSTPTNDSIQTAKVYAKKYGVDKSDWEKVEPPNWIWPGR